MYLKLIDFVYSRDFMKFLKPNLIIFTKILLYATIGLIKFGQICYYKYGIENFL